MSKNYNSTLQANNADLQAILNTINELPEAGNGGDTSMEDGLVTGKPVVYINDRVSTFNSALFSNASTLTSVGFGQVTYIPSNAFYSCHKLSNASFPKATSIGSSAFRNCYSLISVTFPQIISIASGAFA